MGAWVVSKTPSLSQRASPSALGLRDGIFDTTLAPIWYFYNNFWVAHEITKLLRVFHFINQLSHRIK